LKRLADQNLYEILEVPPEAGAPDIEQAYARMKALYGPNSLVTYTLLDPDEAAYLGRRIEEAKATLLDPAERARYDATIGVPRTAPAAEAPNGAAVQPVAREERRTISAVPREEARTPVPADGVAGELPAFSAARVPPPVTLPAPGVAERGEPPQVAPRQAPAAILLACAAEAGGPAEPAAPIPLRNEVASGPGPGAREVVVTEATAWTGEVLRKIREARGLSLPQVSERTKVARHHLENLEADRFGLLPAPVYLRGILMSLARELRLDGQKVARSYLERVSQALGPAPAPPPRTR
jgi:curved DNA-binding protein CbpA